LTNIYINRMTLTKDQIQQARDKRSYGVSWNDVARLRKSGLYIKEVAALREVAVAPLGTKKTILPKVLFSTANYAEIMGLSMAEGRFLHASDVTNNQMVCVLGAGIAKALGREGQVGQNLRMGNSLYKVVGVLTEQATGQSENIKISRENLNELLFLPFSANEQLSFSAAYSESAALSRIIVEIDSRDAVSSAAQLIDRIMTVAHNSVKDYQLVVPLELLQQSLKTQRIFNIVLAVIGGISLLVGGIGIMNIMLATVSERKREIGIRRAVGATRNDIITQFLTESVLLTVSGGVIGVVVGFIFVLTMEAFTGWSIRITVGAMVIPFFLAVITGITFGLYPAIQAARLDPIQALRAV